MSTLLTIVQWLPSDQSPEQYDRSRGSLQWATPNWRLPILPHQIKWLTSEHTLALIQCPASRSRQMPKSQPMPWKLFDTSFWQRNFVVLARRKPRIVGKPKLRHGSIGCPLPAAMSEQVRLRTAFTRTRVRSGKPADRPGSPHAAASKTTQLDKLSPKSHSLPSESRQPKPAPGPMDRRPSAESTGRVSFRSEPQGRRRGSEPDRTSGYPT